MTERTLVEIVYDMKTQDNRITHLPIFAVEKKVRDWGIDLDHTDNHSWLDSEYNEVPDPVADEDNAADSDQAAEERAVKNGWRKSGYRDRWEFVTACFTEEGARRYIELDGHNLGESRIYVHSGYRNQEWEILRKELMEMTCDAHHEMLPCRICDNDE